MKKDRKKDIIEATIKLIRENGSNPNNVTVRDICKEAGVGVSNINYYFGSKDNLLEQCVQHIIGDVIGRFDKLITQYQETSAIDRLKYAVNATASFLYSNENISRISILSDLTNGKADDNTEKTIKAFLPLVEALSDKKADADIKMKAAILCMVLQNLFLRTERIREQLNINLSSAEERKKIIDNLIEMLFKN